MTKLTDKQEMFCREYLVDLNATQAAIRAGYSEDTSRQMGSENLSKPYIQEYIQKLMDKRSEKVEVSANYVLESLVEVAEKCKGKKPVTVSVQLDKDNPESVIEINKTIFDPSGAKGTLELIGKHLVMFTDKVESKNINVDVTNNLSDKALDKAIKEMEDKINEQRKMA